MSPASATSTVREPLPAVVHVTPWDDPVVDRRGHDPRSAYVEQFWLSVLGPTATWLLRRLVAGFDHQPDGYELDVAGTARALGLSVTKGMASPFAKAVQRCVMFGVVQRLDATLGRAAAGAARSPSATCCACRRSCRAAHEQWTTTTIHLDALARAHALATAMLAAGDDRGVLEPQLVAVGVPPPAAAEACELLRQTGRPA